MNSIQFRDQESLMTYPKSSNVQQKQIQTVQKFEKRGSTLAPILTCQTSTIHKYIISSTNADCN